MTLGLDQWLRLLGLFGGREAVRRNIPPLDLSRLAARDIADLNLPQDVLTRLNGRHGDEGRRRVWR